MSIATKTGDQGQTGLIFGQRVPKNHVRLEAYGNVDELNATLGICRAHEQDEERKQTLLEIQRINFIVCSELAVPNEKYAKLKETVEDSHIHFLEKQLEQLEAIPGVYDDWAIPGSVLVGTWYDLARCVCRRTERSVVALHADSPLPNLNILRFLNRLSDVLWLMERQVEILEGKQEEAKLRNHKKDKLGAKLKRTY